MTVSVIQYATVANSVAGHTSTSVTIGTPAAGRTMMIVIGIDSPAVEVPITTPTGWTLRRKDYGTGGNTYGPLAIYTKVAGSSESNTVTVNHGATGYSVLNVLEFSDDAVWDTSDEDLMINTATFTEPSITPVAGLATMLLAIAFSTPPHNVSTNPSGYTVLINNNTTAQRVAIWTKAVASASGSYSTSHTYAGADSGHAVHVAITEIIAFTVDFDATPRSGSGPLEVAFTDESHDGNGTPDTWLWDFGDGFTSTLQDPTHIYPDVSASYTVTLTVTTDEDEIDSLTRTSYIVVTGDHEAPGPGGAIVEIYASVPGSARWGIAHWGEDIWSSAGWQDVTPESVDAVVTWGSHSPESGILAETEAGSWALTTYDPDRILDPGNADGPYYTDLRAGLPIRIRHLGLTIVRQGVCEFIGFSHSKNRPHRGVIRVTDKVSELARTPVPDDSILSDTLRARARDAIAAAGLVVTVEPDPPSGDPALAPRLEGDFSVWQHIRDAAQQTLHVPFIDRIGTLRFRSWAAPYDRGRSVDSTQLVELSTIVQTRGLYSVVQARDEITELIEERKITPTPRYGAVTYTRDDLTPDAGDWAEAVLADRSLQSVQWIPGDIYPLTAAAVEYFATLEAMERLSIVVSEATPEVGVAGIIVGGEFRVVGKKDSAALWRFGLELAQTSPDTPLIDDTDPGEFLLDDTGFDYLYPDT
jgi:PKD repeat protein